MRQARAEFLDLRRMVQGGVRFCPAWKCVLSALGPSHPGTPTYRWLSGTFFALPGNESYVGRVPHIQAHPPPPGARCRAATPSLPWAAREGTKRVASERPTRPSPPCTSWPPGTPFAPPGSALCVDGAPHIQAQQPFVGRQVGRVTCLHTGPPGSASGVRRVPRIQAHQPLRPVWRPPDAPVSDPFYTS